MHDASRTAVALLTCWIASSPLDAGGTEDQAARDRQVLQGGWVVASKGEVEQRRERWFFEGRTVRVTTWDEAGLGAPTVTTDVGRYSLDVEVSPSAMELLLAGERQAVELIYELDGETLRLAARREPGTRPSGFEDSGDTDLIVLRRESLAEREEAEAYLGPTSPRVTLELDSAEEAFRELVAVESPKPGWRLYWVRVATRAPTPLPPATVRVVIPSAVRELWTPGSRSPAIGLDQPALSEETGHPPVLSLLDRDDVNRLTLATTDQLAGGRVRTRLDEELGVVIVEITFDPEPLESVSFVPGPLEGVNAWETTLSVDTRPDRAAVAEDLGAWWALWAPWKLPED